MFADFQSRINSMWRPKREEPSPILQRKHNLCPKCARLGDMIPMDYLGNKHVQQNYTKYDVSMYRCPNCGRLHEEFRRIEGKGKCGANAGKEWGGI